MLRMKYLYVLTALFLCSPLDLSFASKDKNREAYLCLVCQYMIDEVNVKINQVDPRKTLEVGGYNIDSENKIKKIPYARSEVSLIEIFENVCSAMENYSRAVYKDTGSPTVLKFMAEGKNTLNPEIALVDLVTDSDLNESLRYYCEQVIEEHHDQLLQYFGKDDPDVKETICMKKVCKRRITPGNYGEPLKKAEGFQPERPVEEHLHSDSEL